jgi:hypothetical protein
MSYLAESQLVAPTYIRASKLSAWFPKCACSRCTSDVEDSVRFPCPAKCGNGECLVSASGGGGIAACTWCGASYSVDDGEELTSAAGRLAAAERVQARLLMMERGELDATVDAIQSALGEAKGCMSSTHWVSLGLRFLLHKRLLETLNALGPTAPSFATAAQATVITLFWMETLSPPHLNRQPAPCQACGVYLLTFHARAQPAGVIAWRMVTWVRDACDRRVPFASTRLHARKGRRHPYACLEVS